MSKRDISLFIIIVLLMIGGSLAIEKFNLNSQSDQQLTTQLASTTKERDKYKAELAVKNNDAAVKDSTTAKTKDSSSVGVQNVDLKQVDQCMTQFIQLMYANNDRNLMHRYEKMKPVLSGQALEQLKPKSDTPNTDDGKDAATITDIKNYVAPQSTSQIDVLSEYTLNSKVGDNEIKSPMILKVVMSVTDNHYSISQFKTNSAFASNLSERK